MFYPKILEDSIEREKAGTDYYYDSVDRIVLQKMLQEINQMKGTDFHYLAEISAFNIPGAGPVMVKYFDQFRSEGIKGFLIPQIVSDKVEDCARFVLNGYLGFQSSKEYISPPGKSDPAHIYVRYDNALIESPKVLK